MFAKEIIDGQLFVYWRGRLIYKRWLKRGYGVVLGLHGAEWPRERGAKP